MRYPDYKIINVKKFRQQLLRERSNQLEAEQASSNVPKSKNRNYSKKEVDDYYKSLFTPGSETECWLWQGRIAKNTGYGWFCRGQQHLAHRYGWESHTGQSIPKGQVVYQTCKDRSCVNPHHLKLGTYSEAHAHRRKNVETYK